MRAPFIFMATLVLTLGLYGYHVLHIAPGTVVAQCGNHRYDGCAYGTFNTGGSCVPCCYPGCGLYSGV